MCIQNCEEQSGNLGNIPTFHLIRHTRGDRLALRCLLASDLQLGCHCMYEYRWGISDGKRWRGVTFGVGLWIRGAAELWIVYAPFYRLQEVCTVYITCFFCRPKLPFLLVITSTNFGRDDSRSLLFSRHVCTYVHYIFGLSNCIVFTHSEYVHRKKARLWSVCT